MPKLQNVKKYWLSVPARLLSGRRQNLTIPVHRPVAH